MGLDMYIDRIKRDPNDKLKVLERNEVCYWRKNWDLLLKLDYTDDEYGKDRKLTKEDVEEILQFVSHHRDYFGGFSTVDDVCDLLDRYDTYKHEGWDIVFNASW